MKVSLDTFHALVDVERGTERGGVEVYPKSQQRFQCFWGKFANREMVEGKVGGSEEVEPLLPSGYDEKCILFC